MKLDLMEILCFNIATNARPKTVLTCVGPNVGKLVVGSLVVGDAVVGGTVGTCVGGDVGATEGTLVGGTVGAPVGDDVVGAGLGSPVGVVVGTCVGKNVGYAVGAVVGAPVNLRQDRAAVCEPLDDTPATRCSPGAPSSDTGTGNLPGPTSPTPSWCR